ncbi:hypothetical protein KVG95_25175 [Pseudomonas sp. SWRI79]|uniref:Uncharacterized protein n=1 Tax=Pseudomonas farris TaxID=2841207 RepID=A0ABS6Q1K9_9PSED|nr:hypothetical protein [Pseudomonas farris]MBV4466611.1 hypothetical protein [Pseudomonas farris]
MSNIDDEESFYSLRLGEKTVEFRELKGLEAWLDEEKSFWAWLTDNSLGHGPGELFRFVFLEPINRVTNIIKNSEGTSVTELGTKSSPYFDRNSSKAKLVSAIKNQHGEKVAYFALLYLLPQHNLLLQKYGNIKASMSDATQIYAKDLASHIVFSREDVSDLIIRSEEDSIRSQISFFEATVNDANQNLQDEVSKTKDMLSTVEIEYEARAALQKRQFEKRLKFYRDQAKALKNDAKSTFTDAKNDVIAAKSAFHDTADFKASVEYWGERKKSHRIAKNLWLVAVLASMLLTFFGLISYYSAGGATGLAKLLHTDNKTETSASSPSPTATATPTNKKEPSDNAIESNIKSVQSRLTPSNATIIADISGAFLLLTLMGLLIRICLNQFNSSAHYMNDAAERIVFTKTYLALLSENKLNADMDRKLALDSLFRSSNPSTASEIPFSNPIEMVVRSAEKKIT